ncbi:MAG: hypothetical protein WC042_00165 [Candidatus Paceibacterota bacterium]|jgi:hypothetical protein|nr:hypothetical protein [Candidatus Paceibacterota bacterium]MDD3548661.1 hypothetical protein [Candidatus Paceibacterota bacterium]MDD4999199.1 hypothetical protein [Candidatus Paceibacterota bacterium]MDD5545298.1 hypothetical protein [Candidatus Paceibacterota bacterium]
MKKSRRAKKIQHFRIKIFFIGFFIIFVFIFVYWILFLSSFFQVKKIIIDGFDSQKINSQVEAYFKKNNKFFLPSFVVNFFPSLKENYKNYIFLQPDKLSAFLLKQYPEIEKINVRLDVRNGFLFLNIKPRETAFILCRENNFCYCLDKDGIIFKKFEEEEENNSAVKKIIWISSKAMVLGEKVLTAEEVGKLKEIVLMTSSADSPFSLDFFEIKKEGVSEIKIITKEKFYILCSFTDDFSEIMKIIKELKIQIIKNQFNLLEYIDCRYLPKVYYRLRN